MKTRQIALLLATVLFATAAYAGDQEHQKIEIKVISDDGDGETHLSLDSEELGFNLRDMQVGENRSVVDKDGRTILVTRKEDGFTFGVDGKTIDMPMFGAHGERHENYDVHVMHDGMAHERHMAMMAEDGVMVVSGNEIDAATQELIRNALNAAGYESVHFASGHEGGPHQVRMIKEVVKVGE